MNIERLTILAEFLQTVPVGRFDLASWRLDADGGRLVSNEELTRSECGAVACAIGWACVMPEFTSQGLEWGEVSPVFGEARNWTAVMAFFEITTRQAHYLFSELDYRPRATPEMVSDRIFGLIQSNGVMP